VAVRKDFEPQARRYNGTPNSEANQNGIAHRVSKSDSMIHPRFYLLKRRIPG
jgi:hypothetical protein